VSAALPEPASAQAGHREAHVSGLLELARQLGIEGTPSRTTGSLRSAGRARKVSVSMPEQLAEAVQHRVGRGQFSQYVTEAVARQLELDLLGELAALLEQEHGPVDEALLAEAEAGWPDAG
jgi:Arc/MetJ-type ribon-helix-helix transcriptional regulator